MQGSIKILTWFKIPVYLHWSFSLLLPFVLWVGSQQERMIEGILFSGAIISGLFVCVLLHEFGHSLMARRYGINTQDIILTPLGGMARLERIPEKPYQELLVAFAGPLVNIIIAILIYLTAWVVFWDNEIHWWFFQSISKEMMDSWTLFSPSSQDSDVKFTINEYGLNISTWNILLPYLMIMNVIMVIINLIPAFPMDGGRMLRSLMAMIMPKIKATKITVRIGQGIAILFVLGSLFFEQNQIMLLLFGAFIFVISRNEYSLIRVEEVLKNHTAADVLRKQFTKLLSNDWMHTPIDLMKSGQEQHFLVFGMDDQLVGYLPEKRIVEAAKKNNSATAVELYMEEPAVVVSPDTSLRHIYNLLGQGQLTIIALVDEGGEIMGVIDQNGLDSFMKIAG